MPKDVELRSMAELQAYVDKVVNCNKWTRKTFPHLPLLRVAAYDGRRRRRGGASGNRWTGRIDMPVHTRNRLYVLHEIAHLATPAPMAGHGREYAANYLLLVRHFLGVEAHRALRESFKEHRVKYTKKRTVANGHDHG